MTAVELLGYVATVLVVVAMLMGSVVRLRILNAAGAACFGVYGWFVDSTPLVITNAIIVGVHAWKLLEIARHRVDLAVVAAVGPAAPMVTRFLQVHGAEIARTHPDFTTDAAPDLRLAYILRDAAVAGLFAWTEDGDTVTVRLDYVLPAYRDLRCAVLFLDNHAGEWSGQGLSTLVCPPRGQIRRDLRRGWGLLPRHPVPGGLSLAEAIR